MTYRASSILRSLSASTRFLRTAACCSSSRRCFARAASSLAATAAALARTAASASSSASARARWWMMLARSCSGVTADWYCERRSSRARSSIVAPAEGLAGTAPLVAAGEAGAAACAVGAWVVVAAEGE